MRNQSTIKAMKIIDMSKAASAKAYLSRPPEDTHSKEELEAVHRAVRYTQLFKHEESMDKMNEEELMVRNLPKII